MENSEEARLPKDPQSSAGSRAVMSLFGLWGDRKHVPGYPLW